VVVVENACVHQHFNDDQDRPARALVSEGWGRWFKCNLGIMVSSIE
jgi:hypothetical protein